MQTLPCFSSGEERQTLRAKLDSLTSEEIVPEIAAMLKNGEDVEVSIGWFGERCVSIKGYDSWVYINTLAQKFLQAPALNFEMPENVTLKDRLATDDLWTKVKDLYDESDRKLSGIFKTIADVLEWRPYCRACAGDPLVVIQQWEIGGQRSKIFAFTQEEKDDLWPEDNVFHGSIGMKQLVPRKLVESKVAELEEKEAAE